MKKEKNHFIEGVNVEEANRLAFEETGPQCPECGGRDHEGAVECANCGTPLVTKEGEINDP